MAIKFRNFIGPLLLYPNPPKLKRDWELLKTGVWLAINENDFGEAFRLLTGLGKMGYTYNFLEKFTDAEVDKLIVDLVGKLNIQVPAFKPGKQKVAFYDYFTFENRGFTQQYLDVIIENEMEVLYIGNNADQFNDTNGIIRSLKNYSKAKIVALPKHLNTCQKLQLAVDTIASFAPSKIFIHNSPWDILSCAIAVAFKKSLARSYLLNITDHSYWPGADIFDHIIDFRQYGLCLNHFLKGVDPGKLVLIPTPAYQSKEEAFKGFDIDVTGKVVGFAGGSVYKIFDEKNTFLNLIKTIIRQNPSFVFLYANVGEDRIIRKFIQKHGLEKQFHLIGNRKDINEVFRRIDIYFNTFPYGGGLMIQYAIANKKPILALNDPELLYTRLDVVIDRTLDAKYLITDKEVYIQTANKLIRDAAYRKSFTLDSEAHETVENKFKKSLTGVLQDVPLKKIDLPKEFKVNSSAIATFHINNDNFFAREYQTTRNIYFSKLPATKKLPVKMEYYLFRGLKAINLF